MALALGKFPLSTRGGYFEMVQAIANDPVPALSPTSFSPELCNFVELMLQRDPADRAPARALLQHPFLLDHRESRKLVGMVEVPPATRAQVCRSPPLGLPSRFNPTSAPRGPGHGDLRPVCRRSADWYPGFHVVNSATPAREETRSIRGDIQ